MTKMINKQDHFLSFKSFVISGSRIEFWNTTQHNTAITATKNFVYLENKFFRHQINILFEN